MKKPLDKSSSIVQAVLQSSTDPRQSSSAIKNNDSALNDSAKFELKATQSTSAPSSSSTPKITATTSQKSVLVGDQETKEKLEQLEKRVEQQRLKIEELEARNQQEYEPMEELSPERHDESEDEQQLPLKRVFVKKKQSMYDEEQEYNDNDVTTVTPITTPITTPATSIKEEPENEVEKTDSETKQTENTQKEIPTPPKTTSAPTITVRREGKPLITSSKVYGNKKIIVVKTEEASEVEEMSRELCSILDSADSVVKMQETVLSNLSQISALGESSQKNYNDKPKAGPSNMDDDSIKPEPVIESDSQPQDVNLKLEDPVPMDVEESEETSIKVELISQEQPTEQPEQASNLTLDEQDLSESTDIFEPSENVLDVQKSQLADTVIELDHGNHTINLNDTNDSQDSLEDKLQQMEG